MKILGEDIEPLEILHSEGGYVKWGKSYMEIPTKAEHVQILWPGNSALIGMKTCAHQTACLGTCIKAAPNLGWPN